MTTGSDARLEGITNEHFVNPGQPSCRSARLCRADRTGRRARHARLWARCRRPGGRPSVGVGGRPGCRHRLRPGQRGQSSRPSWSAGDRRGSGTGNAAARPGADAQPTRHHVEPRRRGRPAAAGRFSDGCVVAGECAPLAGCHRGTRRNPARAVPGGRFLAIERRVRPGATGLASHGWTDQQAESFAAQCRAAGFNDVRIETYTPRRRALKVVTAIRP